MPTRKWKMPCLFRSCPAWVEEMYAALPRAQPWLRAGSLFLLIGLMAGCAATRPAPVTERLPPAAKSSAKPKPAPATVRAASAADQPRPEFYTVRSGDTLYSIALEFGLDYRELATWNGVDPARIRVGQQLRLAPPHGVVATPLHAPGGAVETQPLGSGPGRAAGGTKIEPRGVRVPYSDQAYAQMAGVKPEPVAKAEVFPDAKPDRPREGDDVDWIWPVTGKIVTPFNDGSSKGIGIGGKMGQPVVAAGSGRVIFSGTGIRGLGKLIVIKHNEKFLSVYAHNRELLVKEGQDVARGQKIAEMGNTDADQVKLHFEIRRLGKPVDPAALLPPA